MYGCGPGQNKWCEDSKKQQLSKIQGLVFGWGVLFVEKSFINIKKRKKPQVSGFFLSLQFWAIYVNMQYKKNRADLL